MPILWERDDPVGIATIDRPDHRNALRTDLCDELASCLGANRGLRVVIITGSGDKAFSAGADLARRASDTASLEHGGSDTFRPSFEALLDVIVGFPAPVLAAVNGAALGAGCSSPCPATCAWQRRTPRSASPRVDWGCC